MRAIVVGGATLKIFVRGAKRLGIVLRNARHLTGKNTSTSWCVANDSIKIIIDYFNKTIVTGAKHSLGQRVGRCRAQNPSDVYDIYDEVYGL